MSHEMLDCVCMYLLPFEDLPLLGDYLQSCQELCFACSVHCCEDARFWRRKRRK